MMAEHKAPKEGKIAVGSDHAGFEYKRRIDDLLKSLSVEFVDMGADTPEPSDYVDYAVKVSEAVAAGQADFGILICGSGVGMTIAADKVPGIRAALCGDTYTARMCREHNDANVLVLAERVIGVELALDIVREWLHVPFSGAERHVRRLEKIHKIEEKYREDSGNE
jgi:ribose 5-phosphate isomerase B